MNTLDELERLLAATQGEEWRVSNRDPVRVVDGTGAYIALCDPHHKGDPLQETRAALIVAAINALPGLIESARRVEMSAWTDDDRRGLSAVVADAMWHWDDMPMDCDDAIVLTSILKSSLQDNGFQIVRLATRAQGESS